MKGKKKEKKILVDMNLSIGVCCEKDNMFTQVFLLHSI
jgi:hypothetical protein